jgi:hypothetical protein
MPLAPPVMTATDPANFVNAMLCCSSRCYDMR